MVGSFLVNCIKIYIIVTCLFAFYKLRRNWKIYKFLISMLLINATTEITNYFLLSVHLSIKVSTNINILITDALWLIILLKDYSINKAAKFFLAALSLFSMINFFFIERPHTLNSYTFIFGAFTYISAFIIKSFYMLKREYLAYFISNNYLLLLAPILYFFGLSFIFSFKDIPLAKVMIFTDIPLYTLIACFVNFIYYSLINIYIYRERKLQHDR